MSHDVFISHSAKDKTTADAVCAMLESDGIRCWIAPRDVTPGMEWGECIIEAIKKCRIMILVFTAHANESSQIRREVERAVNHGVVILPLRLENIVPGSALEFFIGNVHWLDALTPPLETHLKSLAGTVKMLLGRMEPSDEAPVQPASGAVELPQTNGEETAPAAESINIRASPPLKLPREILSRGSAAKPKQTAARGVWLRIILGLAVLLTVWLAWFLFRVPNAALRNVPDGSRIEFALVADNQAKETGPLLHAYNDASKTYSIERDLTLPGDIEYVAAEKDEAGGSGLDIHLTGAAVKRIKSSYDLVGRQIALVLDGRTVLAVATIQSGFEDEVQMTGTFTPDEIKRLLEAISPNPPGNH